MHHVVARWIVLAAYSGWLPWSFCFSTLSLFKMCQLDRTWKNSSHSHWWDLLQSGQFQNWEGTIATCDCKCLPWEFFSSSVAAGTHQKSSLLLNDWLKSQKCDCTNFESPRRVQVWRPEGWMSSQPDLPLVTRDPDQHCFPLAQHNSTVWEVDQDFGLALWSQNSIKLGLEITITGILSMAAAVVLLNASVMSTSCDSLCDSFRLQQQQASPALTQFQSWHLPRRFISPSARRKVVAALLRLVDLDVLHFL